MCDSRVHFPPLHLPLQKSALRAWGQRGGEMRERRCWQGGRGRSRKEQRGVQRCCPSSQEPGTWPQPPHHRSSLHRGKHSGDAHPKSAPPGSPSLPPSLVAAPRTCSGGIQRVPDSGLRSGPPSPPLPAAGPALGRGRAPWKPRSTPRGLRRVPPGSATADDIVSTKR